MSYNCLIKDNALTLVRIMNKALVWANSLIICIDKGQKQASMKLKQCTKIQQKKHQMFMLIIFKLSFLNGCLGGLECFSAGLKWTVKELQFLALLKFHSKVTKFYMSVKNLNSSVVINLVKLYLCWVHVLALCAEAPAGLRVTAQIRIWYNLCSQATPWDGNGYFQGNGADYTTPDIG